MSEQALDLRRALRIVWRHKIAVGAAAALGLLAGAGYAMLKPPMLTSSALVVLAPTTRDVPTQVVIAGSNPVLSHALPAIRPATSLPALRTQVQVKSLTPNIISISVQDRTAAGAESIANAVAASYLAYVSPGHATQAVQAQARLLQPAASATGRSPRSALVITGGLGFLIGGLIGAIAMLMLGRGDRKLRARDEIANAVGVPVLASVPVGHPAKAGDWIRLLEDYQPSVVHAWQLRTALSYLGQSATIPFNGSNGNGSNGTSADGFSLAVLSLSSDRGALALGPQLAVFAATQGIPTSLLIGPQPDVNAAAALRAACAEPPPSKKWPKELRLGVTDHAHQPHQPGVKLTIIVGVVDGQAPRAAGTPQATATVIGVTAGAATATQLVKVAISAATDNRQIAGILVADPDPADHTSGRISQLAWPTPAPRKTPAHLPVATPPGATLPGPITEIRP